MIGTGITGSTIASVVSYEQHIHIPNLVLGQYAHATQPLFLEMYI